jgi:hypothetical protein
MSEKKEQPVNPEIVKAKAFLDLSDRLRRLERNFESVVEIVDAEAHRSSGSTNTWIFLCCAYFVVGLWIGHEYNLREERRKR